MAQHVVATADEIPPGGRKIVKVEGREVGIFNVGGEYVALKNSCPHQGARVCLGKVVGTTLPSAVYEYRYGRTGEILRCPWHGWEYDLRSGLALVDPNVRLVRYPVSVENDQIVVSISS
jgi:nitrite reductase/ring-hydroxylating ferredoxin subunit